MKPFVRSDRFLVQRSEWSGQILQHADGLCALQRLGRRPGPSLLSLAFVVIMISISISIFITIIIIITIIININTVVINVNIN